MTVDFYWEHESSLCPYKGFPVISKSTLNKVIGMYVCCHGNEVASNNIYHELLLPLRKVDKT